MLKKTKMKLSAPKYRHIELQTTQSVRSRKEKYLKKAANLNLIDESIIEANKTNFLIKLSDIKSAIYNPSKKFGMGYYPHDGRVIIETFDNKKREFIILGNQSGESIANLITTK